MGKLSEAYRQKRPKDEEANTPFAFKTGFDLLDYINGKWVHVRNQKPYLSLGIDEGTYIMIIGASGTGKTTFAIQMAKSIVEPYDEGVIYHDDVEVATNDSRIKELTGWDDEKLDECYIHRNKGITAESFYENINLVYKTKMEMKDELMITTDALDKRGEFIQILPPTVYILDSLALLMPEKVSDEEELSGQMSATAAAKTNSAVFGRIIPKLKKANIILLVINHINEKIEINPMIHTRPQVNFLKQNETLPGGRKPVFTANNMIKLEASTKLAEKDLYGINGFIVTITLVKSRSNRANQSFNLVFEQERGFHNHLSNLEYLKANKILKGAGQGYYIEELPDTKFTLKTFSKKFKTDKEFRITFKKKMKKIYRGFIRKPSAIEDAFDEDTGEGVTVEKKKKRK